MASDEVLDFARLLEPIPGENPAGKDLREDLSGTSDYRTIRDARAKARDAERRDVYEDDEISSSPADWNPILELGPKIVAEQSKDLEVVATIIEGLARKHGFPGVRDGFRLARELIEQFWESVYPLPDEYGLETRIAPLAGLNDAEALLIGPLTRVPVTCGGAAGPFSLSDYRQGNELEQIQDPDRRAERLAQPGAVTRQMFDQAAAKTPPEFVTSLLEDISQCSEQFEKLSEVLEEKCGRDESGYSLAPPSSSIRSALAECRDEVKSIYKHLFPGEEQEEMGENGGVAGALGPAPAGAVGSREQAFRKLLEVADFFKRTEPHSPVSYLLEQAVRWGRMPLPDLLGELVPDLATREQLFKLLGIRLPRETE
jgi:type VI secretion system protein ImpA